VIVNPLTGWNLELDVWISTLNKAIEFNGTYWHSLKGRKQRDKIKEEQCKKLGINLLTIKDEDWRDNKEYTMKQIKEFLKEN